MEVDRIYNMDCLEGMKQIPDHSVDCIICDLPYGTTACAWDIIIPFDRLWEQYKRIIKPKGAICLFGSEPFTSALVMSNIKMFRYEWIWEKNIPSNFLCSKIAPLKQHESILVFSKEQHTYNPIKEKRNDISNRWNRPVYKTSNKRGDCVYGNVHGRDIQRCDELRFPSSVQKFNVERGLHPTQKPVNLIRYLIATYSNEGDTILDNCMGSGTTAIACIREKRHFIGFELNEEYFTKANERIKKEKSQLSLF